jgi:hypothetical protein
MYKCEWVIFRRRRRGGDVERVKDRWKEKLDVS